MRVAVNISPRRSATWNPARADGHDVIVVTFPAATCIPCPFRDQCTRSKQRRRQLTLKEGCHATDTDLVVGPAHAL
jgi:hypothetical protein